jgi:glucose-1-phosphate adenylyltransferase
MKQKRQPKVLAMVMAGGKGERLMPLTEPRSKPSVPFAGKYRIVDFVLSNFVNSGFLSIYVLVQYRSQSLIEHLRRAWRIGGRIERNFITVVPPQMKGRGTWYEGTADAVYQNINLILDTAPDLVAVFGADHIYRMDISQMIRFHTSREADVTVAALPVPLPAAKGFGIVEVNPDDRIIGFEEKPKHPRPMPKDPARAYSSMGNYLFNTEMLLQVLEQNASRPGFHDFGRDILPGIIKSNRVMAYNFLDNEVPGLKPYEEHGYWRDVGTLEAYLQAHLDLLGDRPLFDLRNRSWPILTASYDGPATSLVRSHLDDVMIGEGCRVIEANIRRSVIGQNIRIGNGADIEECVILGHAIIDPKVRLRRVIVDRFNHIPAGTEIGFDPSADRLHYKVKKSGIVVLPRGSSITGKTL